MRFFYKHHLYYMISIIQPHFFRNLSKNFCIYLFLFFILILSIGLYYSIFCSPPDYQQGNMVRIMYLHVPSAWMSLVIYFLITLFSASYIIWHLKMFYIISVAIAPIGMSFTFIALITGSIWGKPIWGVWWVWDSRLTSMFILLLQYISYIIIVNLGEDFTRASKPASVIAIIGAVNLPIIKFSVDVWYSLHQPSGIFRLSGSSVHYTMLLPLLLIFTSFVSYFCLISILRVQYLLGLLKNTIRL